MRRMGILLAVCLGLSSLVGCFNYNPSHNSRVWRIVRKDLRCIREDLDFWMGLEQETLLSRTEY